MSQYSCGQEKQGSVNLVFFESVRARAGSSASSLGKPGQSRVKQERTFENPKA